MAQGSGDNRPAKFTYPQGKRIGATVQWVEALPRNITGKPALPSATAPSFYAKLGEEDGNNPGTYEWTFQNYVSQNFQDGNPTIANKDGKYSLQELNLTTGLAVGTYIVMWLAGTDDDGNQVYLFDANSTQIGFWAQLVSNSAMSAARWSYQYQEGNYTSTGIFQTLPGGRSGTCYNSNESLNPTSGIGQMGSGQSVSSSEFSNGIKLQPLSTIAVVWVSTGPVCDNGGNIMLVDEHNIKSC